MKKIILLLILTIFIIGYSKQTEKSAQKQQQTEIANPASVYCEEQGSKLRIFRQL